MIKKGTIEKMVHSIKEKIIKWFSENDNTYFVISLFINPIAYSTLPIIAFILYMAENNFFSYDFFTNGMFGLNTFFIVASLFSLFIGFFLTGSIIPLISLLKQFIESRGRRKIFFGKIKKAPDSLIFFILLLLLNIVINYFLFTKINNHTAQIVYGLIGLLINLHIGVLLFCTHKIKLFSLLLITGILYIIMLNNPKNTAEIVQIGMNKFNISTNSNVLVYNDNNITYEIAKGKLVLLTPNRIFLNNNINIQIIERTGKIIIFTNDVNHTKEHNKTLEVE